MDGLRRLVLTLLTLAVFLAIVSLLFAAALTVLAILAPIFGFSALLLRLGAAAELWRSHGRFQLTDGIRIIAANRARVMAGLTAVEGLAEFSLSFLPTLFVFGPKGALLPLFASGVAALMASRIGRRRVLEGGHPVDVLPPE
jgi:hypothetical protein